MGAGGQRNLAAISRELAAYFSLEITPGLNRLFMCCHWITKPKFNKVCILFKHSNFCSRMLEMHSAYPKRPRFQTFSRNSRLCREFFLLHLLQSFCHLLKILPVGRSWNVGCFLRLGGEKQGEESWQFPLPFSSFPQSFYCPRVFSDESFNLIMRGCHLTWRLSLIFILESVSWETLKIPYSSKLFTVLYFSASSSRSSALRYGLPSCMSVKPPRYIWKSRSPQLTVRRAKSRRSQEKIGDGEQSNIQGVQIPITSPE